MDHPNIHICVLLKALLPWTGTSLTLWHAHMLLCKTCMLSLLCNAARLLPSAVP